jgi:hypothetical protein
MRKFIVATISLWGTSALTAVPIFAAPDVSVGLLQAGKVQVSQVSSVSELSDVDPNQWAFQTLKLLVERYGCIEGYPNKKYLGNRPLSRYEFAAGLDACLDKVGEQIAAATSNLATKDDLAAVQRLQEEFKTELTTLKSRTDILEVKTKELEEQQFSTTTKLASTVVFGITGGGAGGDIKLSGAAPFFGDSAATGIGRVVPGDAANTTFVDRVRINFLTTFTGDDLLEIRLAGSAGDSVLASYSVPAGFGVGDLDYSDNSGALTNGRSPVLFDHIVYSNKIGENFRYFIGPSVDPKKIVDTNSFANNEESDFSNRALFNSPYLFGIVGGDNPSVAFDYSISKSISLRAIYNSAQGGQSLGFGNGGIFGGSNQLFSELEVKPSEKSAIRLQYAKINEQGKALTSSLKGNILNASTDVFGVNTEWAITPNFGIFGRYGTANTRVNSTVDSYSDLASNSYQLGFSLIDFFAPNTIFGISIGQPIRVNAGSENGVSLVPSGQQTNIEAFYNFRLNDRITLSPDVQFVLHPNNIASNPTVTVGTLRMVFEF